MIKCNEANLELSAYNKGDLPAGLRQEMESHLNICASCRNELNALRKLDGLLGNYSVVPVTPDFRAGFRARLARETETTEHRYRFMLNWRRAGLLASAALVLLALTFWATNPFTPTVSHTENEIITNLELLENLETAEMMEMIQDYELVAAMPEIMEIDIINGE